MSLSVGIVGLPNVGKSTLFQAITKKQVDCANYPFCTIDPNVGVVAVIDERVGKLAELTNSKKKVYATVEFVDIAGLVKGASKGEGLGNKFLANIRETDAMVYVLRCFKKDDVINTQNEIDVLHDKEILDSELALKDLETVDKRIVGLEKDVKAKDKTAIKELEVFKKAQFLLSEGKILSETIWTEEEKKTIHSCQLLTFKPRLYLLNGEEKDLPSEVKNIFDKNNWHYIFIDVLSEFEFSELEMQEESKLDSLIKASYKLLGLITFLTTGPDETRAWTLKEGSTAPQAGGVIHSDFEERFVKADVISYNDLINASSFSKARERGLLRIEGKEYVVKDGDVIEIKI